MNEIRGENGGGHSRKRPEDDRRWRDYIFFRDCLNTHPDAAAEYERLKLGLMEEYKNDRLSYTEGKAEFIERILNLREGRENDRACEDIP